MRKIAVLTAALLGAVNPAYADQTADKLRGVDLKPYEKANFPKLYAKYGRKFVVNDIQKLRVAGAREMAKETKCDRVLWSEYSDRSTTDSLVVFVDCANGYRIWYGGGRILQTDQGDRLD
jgi:hypothetical protein